MELLFELMEKSEHTHVSWVVLGILPRLSSVCSGTKKKEIVTILGKMYEELKVTGEIKEYVYEAIGKMKLNSSRRFLKELNNLH